MVRLLGLVRGESDESPREITSRTHITSDSSENGWLIRFFDSSFFCEWIAVSYLYKHEHSGVRDYLCNRMYTLPLLGIEGYLFQICYMSIHKPSPSLDKFVIDMCSKSLKIALKVHWFLMAELEDTDDNEGISRIQEKCQIAATLMGEWPPLVRPHNDGSSPGSKNQVLSKILSSKQRLLSLASSPPTQKSLSFSPSSRNILHEDASQLTPEENKIFKKFMPGPKVRDALLFRKSVDKEEEESEKDGFFKRLLRDSRGEDEELMSSSDGFFKRLLRDSKTEDEELTSSSEGFFKRLFRDSKSDSDEKSVAKSLEDDEKEGFFKKFFKEKFEDKKDGNDGNEDDEMVNSVEKSLKSAEDDEKEGFFRKFFKDKKDGNDKIDEGNNNAEDEESSDFSLFRRLFRVHPEDAKNTPANENSNNGVLFESSPGTENFFRKLFRDRDRSVEDSELFGSKKHNEKRPGSPKQQNEKSNAKPPLPINTASQFRKGAYHESLDFVHILCETSYGLVDIFPVEDRKIALRESLAEINLRIAEVQSSGGICFPMGRGMYRVFHIPEDEAVLLNSREKAPYLICVEVLKSEQPSNSKDASGAQKLSRGGIPLANSDAFLPKPPPWAYPLWTRGRRYDDLLEKLKITLLTVTALLNDAEEKQFYSPAVEKWLHMAKDALYDAEDVLDDLATEALKSKLETNSQTNNTNQVNQWRRLSSPLSSPLSRGIDKLNKIIEKLEFIAKYKDILGLNDDVKGRFSLTKLKLPTTTSLVDESCVYGRDHDKKSILELLLMDEPSSNNKIGVIPIVGMGGVGKTMLAQLVYNDDQVQQHFDLRVWVCVSDQVDVLRVTTTILKSVTSKSVAHLDDLNLLQVSLRENLLGKKFLLVLDDVWSRRNNDWDLLWNPLKAGGRGSKIIVTTRDSNVAASMGTVPAHHLKRLSFEDCWAIFMNQAFENRNVCAFPSLEMIGTKIVKKCEGLPLAAKRLGILLRSRQEEEEWYDVLNRKIWALPDDESDIIQTLGLSYHHLPPHLKQCFAYCSIFPAGYEFDKDSLVLLWMAEGFVQQPKGTKKLEEVGNEYFHELVSRSFFQPSVHNNSLYEMHGLMKDLAHFVTGDFSFQLEDKVMDDDQNTIFDKARHSSYLRSRRELLTKFEVFNGAECLRTFLPLDPTGEIGASYLANEVPCEILPKLKNLRVLSFSACRISELPDSIGALKHLRYMDLSRTAIKRLPDSTGTLYNLQTLILLECYSLCKLPMEIGNLTCLRHLRISETRLREMPLQMYRLKNLQTLSHFVVGKDSGSRIRDLRDMKQLQGTLVISGLQNVMSFIDAVEANLKDKKGLAQLVFQWNNSFDDSTNEKDEEEVYKVSRLHRSQDLTNSDHGNTGFPSFRETMGAYRQESVEFKLGQSGNLDDSRNERVEMEVFEMLQPHENIKEVLVKDYGGTRFPSWIGSPSFFNMIVLKLSNCTKCQTLPPLGQLPSLRDLTVEGMEGIKSVGAEFYGDMSSSSFPFPSLEALKFENMSQWEFWYSSGVEDTKCFPHLQNIEICSCPKLRRFSHCFPSLKRMIINGCQLLEALPTVDSLEQGREFPRLRELSVSGCHNLMELPSFFPSLTTLEIDGCQDLEVLPELPSIVNLELNKCENKVLQSIVGSASLTYMRICKISNLECLVEGYLKRFTSLEELQISHLGELVTLSNEIGLQSLLSLKLLEISGCPFLTELPQNLYKLSSLKVLRIWNCPSLVSFPVTGLPSTLIGLEIKSCEALQLLPAWMMHDPHMKNERNTFSLEYLVIEGCPCLVSLPREDELSDTATLKGLEIQDCEKLQSLPEKMICNNTCLEIMKVSGCHCIESLPIISSSTVMKLKELVISNCKNLQPLPEGLHNLAFLVHLEIDSCPLLQSFPEPGLPASMLRSIRISNCQNLNRLPNRMYSLTCLQELSINGCSSIVSFPEGGLPANLSSLSILDCQNLKPSSEWGLHRLTCLTDFSFGGCDSLVSFPEGCLLPASVSSLHLERLPNLKSLPKGLKNLNCLETLEIWECDSLKTLPEKQPSTMLLSLWDAF